jgi:cytochrome c556
MLGAGLAVGIWLLAGASALADDDEDAQAKKLKKEALKDVEELVKTVQSGKKIDPGKLKAIKKKYEELNFLMYSFKPRARGGLGVGRPAPDDGIEIQFTNLGKGRAPIPEATIKDRKDDFLKMAHVALALHEVARMYAPTKPVEGKTAKDWNQYNDDLKKSTEVMMAAVKANDGKKLKKAILDINAACTNCHTDFRGK